MLSATPQLQLDTLFVLSESGRILSTRRPLPSPGPAFMLIRGATEVAWAVRDDVADELADELADLARQEPVAPEWHQPPIHARRYQAALRGRVDWGPAFEFPEFVPSRDGVVAIHDEAPLGRHFSGWVAGEIEAGAAPMMAVLVDGHAVSVCFCARRSLGAAEAGLETAPAFRGRGLATRVTTAWAGAVRASGRTPLYSTSWANASSLAVARKLGLRVYATNWSIVG
jgi:RimJ/RimL family protein N-acetyltransferase